MSEEEKSLFASAVSDVTPLKPSKKTQQAGVDTQARYRQTLKKLRQKNRLPEALSPAMQAAADMDAVADVGAFESLLYHRKGLRLQDLSRLKKGEFAIEAELDLHGLTEEQADSALLAFIERCHQAKKRCVLVIHGKGYNSEVQAPVLKNLTNRRLRQMKAVIAFCSTQPKDGGTGSLYVLLKAH
nr:Smr/MutS family protein [Thiomicrorhabdus cannonii]